MKSGKLTSEQKMVFAVLESRMVSLVFKVHVNSKAIACSCPSFHANSRSDPHISRQTELILILIVCLVGPSN